MVVGMYARKAHEHGKPQSVVSDDQPEASEGQAGRPGVAERFVVPLKPGNAGGGKGPQFRLENPGPRSPSGGESILFLLLAYPNQIFATHRRLL